MNEDVEYIIVDPPSGWRYGFPKAIKTEVLNDKGKFVQFLMDNGYPEEDIDLALKYSRYWNGE